MTCGTDRLGSAADLLDAAPLAPDEAALLPAWLLGLEPAQCLAVFPTVLVEFVNAAQAEGSEIPVPILNRIAVAVRAQARRMHGDLRGFAEVCRACEVPCPPGLRTGERKPKRIGGV